MGGEVEPNVLTHDAWTLFDSYNSCIRSHWLIDSGMSVMFVFSSV